MKKDIEDIKSYYPENDFIAQKIIWSQYILNDEIDGDKIKKMQDKLAEDIKLAREKEL